ncbi:DUF2489 domain-containing protein [Paraliomyxa miuraensis]|uniref:DUF2489 domain-containing protein n=1 Tax=Paraliomyxa miuraensis TaxID=376150 RepID=UPI00225932A3|nr:DUF2489 domain-containing protein [Paraliomyxa miuraensis]MCX4245432.1 DUF2489 domain-containing protein [Paraliomyxa miuraensis]
MSEVSPSIRMQLCLEDVLRGRVPLFDGIEALLRLALELPALAGDRDLARLTEMLAEAEHLPVGAERAHWQAQALHRVDRELMALERRHQDSAFYCCRRLMQTLQAMPQG